MREKIAKRINGWFHPADKEDGFQVADQILGFVNEEMEKSCREVAEAIFAEIENRAFLDISTHRFSHAEQDYVESGWYADLKAKHLTEKP